jgi:hypothetical protein
MTIGISLFAITLGAILKFAVTAHATGIDLATVGVILMVVGGSVCAWLCGCTWPTANLRTGYGDGDSIEFS